MVQVNMNVDLAGIKMKSPITTASGTFGFGREYAHYGDLNELGAITVNGITLAAQEGNPPPRIVETSAGILNAVGLENPGVDAFIQEELSFLKNYNLPVIVNMAGNKLEDYQRLAARLDGQKGIAGLEVNISCPNVAQGGMAFGTDCLIAGSVIEAVKSATHLPVIAKLSPNVTNVVEVAQAVQTAGADALSMINTVLGMAIDIHRQEPILANKMGGLSGPAIKPIAVRMIWQVSQAVDIPIIGMGGVASWQDAVELMLAGATAVAVGTINFVNPQAAWEITVGIEQYLKDHNFSDINQIIGLAWQN